METNKFNENEEKVAHEKYMIAEGYVKVDGKWEDKGALGPDINTPKNWESMPTISSDGNTMYFVSDRPGGFGGLDIYVTRRDANGKWQKAVNMGPAINTPGNEKSPFIHTDSQTLYFSSSSF